MAAIVESTVRVKVPVGNEDVTFILQNPGAREISAFLNSRFETRRNKVQSKLYEARRVFIDRILVDVENAEYRNAEGVVLPLNANTVLTEADKAYWSKAMAERVEGWRDLIPVNWKSAAAMRFEDAVGSQEDDAGPNS